MERLLNELLEKLHRAHGEALTAVILYGSAALGDGRDPHSDYNVLCVLDSVTPKELAASEPVLRWWREMKNPSPLLLSVEEVHNASDCFPMEFHDIKAQRRVLYGTDVFENVEIDDSFYRAMVEHELRAKLLRLRQKAGGLLSDRELLLRLMVDSVSTFCVLFRHAVVLAGGQPEYEKRKSVAAAQQRFQIDPGPFQTLLDVREEKVRPGGIQPELLFREYLKQIQVVVDNVDKIGK
jgi:predicted nucleotidyltransferase